MCSMSGCAHTSCWLWTSTEVELSIALSTQFWGSAMSPIYWSVFLIRVWQYMNGWGSRGSCTRGSWLKGCWCKSWRQNNVIRNIKIWRWVMLVVSIPFTVAAHCELPRCIEECPLLITASLMNKSSAQCMYLGPRLLITLFQMKSNTKDHEEIKDRKESRDVHTEDTTCHFMQPTSIHGCGSLVLYGLRQRK